MNKFDLQDEEYEFPYHYLAHLDNETPSINKQLSWGVEYLTYIEHIKSLIINNINPKSFLDIGCGDGYLINSLEYSSNNNYKGIDLSKKAISFANSFSKGYQFESIDLFDIKDKFQLVTLIEVIEHIPDEVLDSFIKEAMSKVSENGYFIISVPTDVDPIQEKHYRHYNEDMLDKQINMNHFKLINEARLYKKSKLLEKVIKFVFNKKSKRIKKYFWHWHKKNFFYANKNNGKHLVRVYKKHC